jgi:hypothetical protein
VIRTVYGRKSVSAIVLGMYAGNPVILVLISRSISLGMLLTCSDECPGSESYRELASTRNPDGSSHYRWQSAIRLMRLEYIQLLSDLLQPTIFMNAILNASPITTVPR